MTQHLRTKLKAKKKSDQNARVARWNDSLLRCIESIKGEGSRHREKVRSDFERVYTLGCNIARKREDRVAFMKGSALVLIDKEPTFVNCVVLVMRTVYSRVGGAKRGSKFALIGEFLLHQRIEPDRVAHIVNGCTLTRLKNAAAILRRTQMDTGRSAPTKRKHLDQTTVRSIVLKLEEASKSTKRPKDSARKISLVISERHRAVFRTARRSKAKLRIIAQFTERGFKVRRARRTRKVSASVETKLVRHHS